MTGKSLREACDSALRAPVALARIRMMSHRAPVPESCDTSAVTWEGAHRQRPAIQVPLFPELSAGERRVLELIAHGKSNAAIAEQLALGPKTMRNYISSIFGKLQVADHAQAIVKARDAGLGG